MREWLSFIIKIILIIVIAIILINDIGAIAISYWKSYVITDEIIMATLISYRLTGSQERAQVIAKEWADQRGVKLTNMYVEENELIISIEFAAKETYIVRHFKILRKILPTSRTVRKSISK